MGYKQINGEFPLQSGILTGQAYLVLLICVTICQ